MAAFRVRNSSSRLRGATPARLRGASGGAVALSGTIAASSSVTGALGLAQALSGAVAASATVTGALSLALPLSGTIAAASSVDGALRLALALSGTIAASSSLIGDLSIPGSVPLSGTIAASASVTGALRIRSSHGQDALQSQVALLNGLYSWSDFESPLALYKARLQSPISISKRLPDVGVGILAAQQVSVSAHEYATQDGWSAGGVDRMPGTPNSEVTLADLVVGQDLYGQPATARLVDLSTNTAYLTTHGTISDVDAGNGSLTLTSLDLAALAQDVPKRRLLDLFGASVDLSTAPSNDPRVIKVFKEARQVRLTRVSISGGYYNYGAIVKPTTGTLTLNTVYRGKAVVPSSQYEFYEFAQLYFVRFSRAQTDASGQELEIRVDLTSTEFATQAECAQWVLSDPLDGLGKSVNAASFAAASAALVSAGYAAGGWIGPEPWRAEDVLNGLAVRGTVFDLNNAREITMTIDAASLHVQAAYNGEAYGLGRGDNHWENIARVASYKQRKAEDRVREYAMQGLYSENFGQPTYLLQARAQRNVVGKIGDPVSARFIGDLTTLRKEAGYRLARIAAAEQSLTLEVINEARVLDLNETVTVTVPAKRLSPSVQPLPWQCVAITGTRDNWTVELAGYDAGQYSAQAASYVSAPAASILSDYSFTAPTVAPTLGTITFESVLASDGSQEVVMVVPATAPGSETQTTALRFHVFKTGESIPVQVVDVACVAGDTKTAKIGPLAPGKVYDVTVFCFAGNNAPGLQLGVGASSTNKTATNNPGEVLVGGGGPTGVRVKSGYDLKIETHATSPGRIVFIDGSGNEKANIVGDTDEDLKIRPTTDEVGSLLLGTRGEVVGTLNRAWEEIELIAAGAVFLQADAEIELGPTEIRLNPATNTPIVIDGRIAWASAHIETGTTKTDDATNRLNRYIKVYLEDNSGVAVYIPCTTSTPT